jgi:hypothetical protein
MSALSDDERDDDESPWRFGVDEVGEDAGDPESDVIEPESLEFEHVAFVLLGVALSALAFYAAFGSL